MTPLLVQDKKLYDHPTLMMLCTCSNSCRVHRVTGRDTTVTLADMEHKPNSVDGLSSILQVAECVQLYPLLEPTAQPCAIDHMLVAVVPG